MLQHYQLESPLSLSGRDRKSLMEALAKNVPWMGNRFVKISFDKVDVKRGNDVDGIEASVPHKSVYVKLRKVHIRKLFKVTSTTFGYNPSVTLLAQNLFALIADAEFLRQMYQQNYDPTTCSSGHELNALACILLFELRNVADHVQVYQRDQKIEFLSTKPEVVRGAIWYAVKTLFVDEAKSFITELVKDANALAVAKAFFFDPNNQYACDDNNRTVQAIQQVLLPKIINDPTQRTLVLGIKSSSLRKLVSTSTSLPASNPTSMQIAVAKTDLESVRASDKTGYVELMLAQSIMAAPNNTLSDLRSAMEYVLSGLHKAAVQGDFAAYSWLRDRVPPSLGLLDWELLQSVGILRDMDVQTQQAFAMLQSYALRRDENVNDMSFKINYLNVVWQLNQSYNKRKPSKRTVVIQSLFGQMMHDALKWLQQHVDNEEPIDYVNLLAGEIKSNAKSWLSFLNLTLRSLETLDIDSVYPIVLELKNHRNQMTATMSSELNLIVQQLVYLASVNYKKAKAQSDSNAATASWYQIRDLLNLLDGQPEYAIAYHFAKQCGYLLKGKEIMSAAGSLFSLGTSRKDEIDGAILANPNNLAAHLQAREQSLAVLSGPLSAGIMMSAASIFHLVNKEQCRQYVGEIMLEEVAKEAEQVLRHGFNTLEDQNNLKRYRLSKICYMSCLVALYGDDVNVMLEKVQAEFTDEVSLREAIESMQADLWLPLGIRQAESLTSLLDGRQSSMYPQLEDDDEGPGPSSVNSTTLPTSSNNNGIGSAVPYSSSVIPTMFSSSLKPPPPSRNVEADKKVYDQFCEETRDRVFHDVRLARMVAIYGMPKQPGRLQRSNSLPNLRAADGIEPTTEIRIDTTPKPN